MKKVKIAQIGTSRNSHGSEIWKSLTKQNDIFEVCGYAMPENEKEKFMERLDVFEGYPELTVEEILTNPEIEAVAIETEEIFLTKYAKMAAEHKKHIHMEKPGGIELSDFENLIEIVKRNKTVFQTGYMYRFNPYIIELKEQIKNGELGDIISVEAQMNCIHPKNVRDWLGNFPGGMMFFLGCHLVDLILSIQGQPEKIIPLNKCSFVDDVTSLDFGMVVFEYKNGISFAKTSAVEIGGFERRQIVVSGTKKTIELKPLEWNNDSEDNITSKSIYENENWHIASSKQQSKSYKRYDSMMRNFGEMVRGEKENQWDYDYELELYKTILKACGK